MFEDLVTDSVIAFSLLIALWVTFSSFRRVRPMERGLIERFGKYHKFASGGLTFVMPFVDRLVKVNITERMTPVERQDVITKDKVFMGVDAVVFYKVKPDQESVKSSEYNVNNFASQIDTLARTVLRDIVGGMDMAEANTSRPTINTKLKDALDEQTEAWGIQIVRAEIKDLEPPKELVASMEEVLKADNQRQANEKTAIAVTVLATGKANALAAEADGDKRAAILRADGDKQAAILRAEGQAKATELTNTALTTYFKESAIISKQLDTIAAALKDNTKVIVPEGKTISLILNELDNAKKLLPVPVSTQAPPTSDES